MIPWRTVAVGFLRGNRIEIKSPIDGVIMDLPQTAAGAVVAPGGA